MQVLKIAILSPFSDYLYVFIVLTSLFLHLMVNTVLKKVILLFLVLFLPWFKTIAPTKDIQGSKRSGNSFCRNIKTAFSGCGTSFSCASGNPSPALPSPFPYPVSKGIGSEDIVDHIQEQESLTDLTVNSSSSSVTELNKLLSVASNYKAVVKISNKASQNNGEVLGRALRNNLHSRLDSLDILQNRRTVITPTPPQTPRTSTPSGSLGWGDLHSANQQFLCDINTSAASSNLSSIKGDPFVSGEQSESVFVDPVSPILSDMDDVKKRISSLNNELKFEIRNFSIDDVNEDNVGDYKERLGVVSNALKAVVKAIEDDLLLEHAVNYQNKKRLVGKC